MPEQDVSQSASASYGAEDRFNPQVLDRTVKSQEDIEGLLGLPFLGLVPSVDPQVARASRELHVVDHPTSSAAECCRVVRTNILFWVMWPATGMLVAALRLLVRLLFNGARSSGVQFAVVRRPRRVFFTGGGV